MDRLLSALARVASRRPRLVLALLVTFTIPAAVVASGLEVSTSRTALVSEDQPHWRRYMAFAREFGIPEDLVLVAKADDPAAVRAFVDDVARRLDGNPNVGPIFHRIDLVALEARAPLHLGEPILDRLHTLASHAAFGSLIVAEDPAVRLKALAALISTLPATVGAGVEAHESALLAEALESLVTELERFSKGGGPPLDLFGDPGQIAAVMGGPRRGIDAEGYLSTKGGRVGVMFVRPTYTRDEIEVVRPFVAAVREAGNAARADHPGVWFGLTGIPASEIDELETISKDTILTTIVALAGVVVLFLLYFPALRLLVFALMPVAFGVVWTAAAIEIAFGYVNLMSSIFLVVLIGMGIDFSVHISARFLEERRHGANAPEAAQRAVERTGRGVITGGVTSAGAFLAVGWSGFRGIEELGIAASIGLVFTLVFALVSLPALLSWAGGTIDLARRRRISVGPLVDAVLEHKAAVVAVAVALTVPSLIGANRTPFDFSLLELLPEDAESAVLMGEMIEDRELSANAAAIVADDLEAARALTERIGRLDSVHSVVSAATFIPPHQRERLARLETITATLAASKERAAAAPAVEVSFEEALDALESTLEQLSELAFSRGHKDAVDRMSGALDAVDRVRERLEEAPEATAAGWSAFDAALEQALDREVGRLDRAVALGPMTPDDLPVDLERRFVSEAGRYAIYAVPKESVWDRPALGRFLADLRSIEKDVTGFPETFYENAEIIRQGFLRAALFATIAVVVLLLVDLRRPSHVASAMVPVVLGAVWMLGAMYVIDLPYNLANIVGLPLVIGVGIDNGVHILHRFRESGSIRIAAVETGGAVTLSSLTTMVGFGSLALASHRGLSSLGQILFVGVGACLLAALTVLLVTLSRDGGRHT